VDINKLIVNRSEKIFRISESVNRQFVDSKELMRYRDEVIFANAETELTVLGERLLDILVSSWTSLQTFQIKCIVVLDQFGERTEQLYDFFSN